jgi:aminodeoxyfutalosine deaminase
VTRIHRGAWILPITRPPIRNGWIAVDRSLVVAVGGPDDPLPAGSQAVAEASPDDVAILPGLVNAHVHLELSWMRDRVPPEQSMVSWARTLLALRREAGADPLPPIRTAIDEAHKSGTALVGDVTNSLASYDALADSELSAAVFHELIGFRVDDPAELMNDVRARLDDLMPIEWLRPSAAPHAPYSVSPELFGAIDSLARDRGRPLSVHLGESVEEVQFLRDGSGPWRQLLEDLGAWRSGWIAPGCGSVEYLDRLGIVNERLIAVHGVQLTDEELRRLAAAGATIVTCPRSNIWTGAGVPPVDRFYQSGGRVAVGTDSLASVPDLNLFSELAEVRRIAPLVAAARILRSATLDGAAALGFSGDLGSIEPGKRAELLAVRVPADVPDVEEYLVRGIEPANVRWLERD